MILVVGATGMVGSEICRLLKVKGLPARALVRSSSERSKVARLEELGAQVVEGDLRDPRSLEMACRGVSTVITTASSMPFAYAPGDNTPMTTDQDGALALVAVAAAAGRVRHLVYTSFPPMPVPFPLQDAKRAVEAALRGSGLTHTILQPTMFMEVWLSPAVGFDYAGRKATVFGAGENPISWISYLDVARFAVASLDNEAARNATLVLGGPEALSRCEVVRLFEERTGARFEVTSVPVKQLEAQLAAATDPMQKSFAALMLSCALDRPIDMTGVLRAFPMKLRTLREYAASVA